MNKTFRNLLFVSLATVLAIGCQSGDPLVNEAKDAMTERNYQAALAAAEQALAQNANNVAALYYKASAHSEIAREIPEVDARPSEYTKMRETVETVYSISDTLAEIPPERALTEQLATNTWAFELNQAVEIVNSDSIMNADPQALPRAVSHLENATIINPDSVLTFDILSQVQYMNQNTAGAIEAIKQVIDMQETPAARDYDRLAAFYMIQNDYDSAIPVLEESMEMYADSVYLVQKLADSYTSVGRVEDAVSAIETLIESEPNNPQYRVALGSQLAKATDEPGTELSDNYDKLYELRDELDSASGSEKAEIQAEIDSVEARNQELIDLLNDYSSRAEEQLKTALELDPENMIALRNISTIYNNNAVNYFDLRNYILDNEESERYGEMAKQELRKAVEYYERIVELDPEDRATWAALGRAYVTLDMQEKAEAAMEKAGM